ncbi:MAG: hypothetical protein KME16_06230 [Scytolyngbya sp. HA4215-MV1]|jgi:cell shape-determining protein MreC|nr:hypothetical protein [Scytolyngbya sp. HA4215-MV1]
MLLLTVVLIINVLLALICLWVAWKLRQLRRTLARVIDTLLYVEQVIYQVLHSAPDAILKGQSGSYRLQQQYQNLQIQLQRLQQILVLVNLGRTLWARKSVLLRNAKPSLKTSYRGN